MSQSEIDRLLASEVLRQLKARDCRFVDTKQWGWLEALFTADARLDGFGSVPDGTGPAAFVAGVAKRLDHAITVHHVHAPEIDLTGPDAARAVWAMMDYVDFCPDGTAAGAARERGWVGWGYYQEEYARVEGAWRIAHMRLTRLRIDALTDDHPAARLGRHNPSPGWL